MSKEIENKSENNHEQNKNNKTKEPKTIEITPEQQKLHQKEMQRQFNMFKKLYKVKPKSELVAIIWEQGLAYHDLQTLAREMHEELIELKGANSESKEK